MPAPAATPIALIGPTHPAPGGIVHFTEGLAAALAARGPTLVLGWSRRFPERLYPGTIADEVSSVRVSAEGEAVLDLLNPRTWRRAARRIRASGARVAVVQWWHPMHGPVIRSLARRLRRDGIATVAICHNVEPHESGVLWRALTRASLRSVDAIVVHAEALRAAARAAAPRVPVSVAFMPAFDNVAARTGAADPGAVAELRSRLGAADRPLLLCFGYVRPYKGVADAIAALPASRRRPVLLVAGECWEDAADYRAQAQGLGVSDDVHLDLRYVPNDELPVLFAAADAVVLPYRAATQSAVAALAFAYDRPVVATRTGGLAELVEDGVTGALCAPNDPPGLAAAIDRVLEDPRDWRPAIAAARARLSWDRYARILLDAVPAPSRDRSTHAILDAPSRRAKAAKILWVLRRARPLEGARVLDVGTGSGTIAAEIARAAGPAGRVTSVDVADVRVERDGFAFLAYDGVRLPAADASADVVVSNHVIEHVGGRDAQRGHVREIARVLAPGGVAYVAAPHRWRLIENHYRLPLLSWLPARLADRYVRATGRADRYDCRLVTVRELRAMCRDAGLDARDATPDLVAASAALDGGAGGAALRLGVVRRLAAGPLAPSVAVVARRPPLSPG